jgi:pimeloyl-ACP methyl ester carboxylesterase
MGVSPQIPLDPSEEIEPSRKRDLSFYIVLLFVVAPLWGTVPLSWAFVVYALRSGSIWTYTWLGRSLFLLALCEVFFSVYHHRLATQASGPTPYGPGNLADLQAAFQRVLKAGLANLPDDGYDEESFDTDRPGSPAESILQLEHDDPRAIDFRQVLRTWFGRVPWSAVRKKEIYAWLYWSIFNTELPPLDTLPPAHRTALEEALDLMQKRTGAVITEGSAPDIQPMRLTLDKVNITWRPFWWYATVGVVNRFMRHWFVQNWGAYHRSYDGLEYLVRIPEDWDPNAGPRPIVFIHGLGLGLLQYHVLLKHLLQAFADRPILIPLQPHVSQDIFHPRYLTPMTRHETADRLAALLIDLGWAAVSGDDEDSDDEETMKNVTGAKKGVTMLSHSNGSYTHAWMLKGYPEMISRSCFVDPVTFCSWEGDVCYNFIYRPCKTGIELVMRYFVGTELGVANLLQRHFDWSSNALWYEEIPHARDPTRTLFLLGGKDDIVNAERVQRYLRSHGVRKGLWLDPNGRHGQALISGGAGHTKILSWLREEF